MKAVAQGREKISVTWWPSYYNRDGPPESDTRNTRSRARIRLISNELGLACCDRYHFSGYRGGVPVWFRWRARGSAGSRSAQMPGRRDSGKLLPQSEEEIERCKRMELANPHQVLFMDDLVRKGDDAIFAATGVTDGELLRGATFSRRDRNSSVCCDACKNGKA